MKLIDKDALVAEIEKLEKLYCYGKSDGMLIAKSVFDSIKNIINTFEVKEVDLDALGVLANHLIACNAHGVTPKYSDRELDFLEGLANNKVQKGEEV
jgi:hypothetical protein